jgi:hypothetical protein
MPRAVSVVEAVALPSKGVEAVALPSKAVMNINFVES